MLLFLCTKSRLLVPQTHAVDKDVVLSFKISLNLHAAPQQQHVRVGGGERMGVIQCVSVWYRNRERETKDTWCEREREREREREKSIFVERYWRVSVQLHKDLGVVKSILILSLKLFVRLTTFDKNSLYLLLFFSILSNLFFVRCDSTTLSRPDKQAMIPLPGMATIWF